MKKFYIVFFLLAPFSLYAYLDPGTGSLLLYAIVGIASSLLFFLRNLGYSIVEFLFSKSSTRSTPKTLPDIVIHSEGGRYWQVFESILEAFSKKNIPVAYVTPEKNDPAFEWAKAHPSITVINPGNEMMTLSWLNHIETKLVLSTTPGLDVYMWKKSKKVKRYAHIFHSPTTVEFYEFFALSFYDDIICSGEFQKPGIIELDTKRNLEQKNFHIAGLSYYDYMLKEMKNLPEAKNSGKKTILYAPTWGLRSSLDNAEQTIQILLDANYDVIFRPHPQSFISDKEIIDSILNTFKKNTAFLLDKNRTAIEAMHKSDCMITDFSGVMFDYLYLFNKPVILATVDAPVGGYEAEEIESELWDVTMGKKLSIAYPENPDQLVDTIKNAIKNKDTIKDEILKVRDETIMNFGKAGEAIVDVSLKILNSL